MCFCWLPYGCRSFISCSPTRCGSHSYCWLRKILAKRRLKPPPRPADNSHVRLLLVFRTFALFGQTPPEEKRAGSPLAPAEQQRNSLAKQKETARKQAASAGALLMPWEEWRLQPSPALEADCDALADSTVKPLIEGAARQQNVDAKLLRAVME